MSALKQNVVPFPQHRVNGKPSAPSPRDLHAADMVAGMRFLDVLEHFECVLLAAITHHKKHHITTDHKKLVS